MVYGVVAPPPPILRRVPGVNRMTEVTISEQMTRMTRRAIAIPFQFLCGGLLPTSSYREKQRGEERHGQKQYRESESEYNLLRRDEDNVT